MQWSDSVLFLIGLWTLANRLPECVFTCDFVHTSPTYFSMKITETIVGVVEGIFLQQRKGQNSTLQALAGDGDTISLLEATLYRITKPQAEDGAWKLQMELMLMPDETDHLLMALNQCFHRLSNLRKKEERIGQYTINASEATPDVRLKEICM